MLAFKERVLGEANLDATVYRRKYMPPMNKLLGYEFYRAALAQKMEHAARS
jgi:hypothetical protein